MTLSSCKRSGPDWRIQQLFGGTKSVELLENSATIEAFRLAPPGAAPKLGEVHAGPYVAAAPSVAVPADAAIELRKILGDAATYDWQHTKRDPFRPQVGLWFIRGAYILEVALDVETAQMRAFAGGQSMGVEDFDAARPRLVALVKRTFPDDAAIQALR